MAFFAAVARFTRPGSAVVESAPAAWLTSETLDVAAPPVILNPGGPDPASDFAVPEFPPGMPGCAPSGEMAKREERFPAGTAGGATGAGVAESAINRVPPESGVFTSGAATSSAAVFVRPAFERGDSRPAGSVGRAIAGSGAAMSIAARSRGGFATSGAATSCCKCVCRIFGSRRANSAGSIFSAGAPGVFHATIFGKSGKIVGGTGAESGWIRVCRG